jgi:putative glycosyltransferase (TIGR04372 family)
MTVARDVNSQVVSRSVRSGSSVYGAGSIRRLVNAYVGRSKRRFGFLHLILTAPGTILRWLSRLFGLRLLGRIAPKLASTVYQLLARRRANVRPIAARLSDLFEEMMQEGARGDRLLQFSVSRARQGWRRSARGSLFLLRYGLVLAIQAHLAAGRYARATKSARLLNLLFRPFVTARRIPETVVFAQALFYTKMFDRIAGEFSCEEPLDNYYLALFAGVSHLYCLNTWMAKKFLQQAIGLVEESHAAHRMLGRVYLVEGHHTLAAAEFERSVTISPSTVMSHQNYAGRYLVSKYKPKSWELANAGHLLIYDNLTQLAEDLFLLGNMDSSMRFYQLALSFQYSLAEEMTVPKLTKLRLADACPNFDPSLPIRILSYEWVTQFGHLGLLDSYKKMAELGIYPHANYVLLAPKVKVSNSTYLSYWEPHFCIVRDKDLVDEIFPFQRYVGDQFMALPSDGPLAKPWTAAAAQAQVSWMEQRRGPLLELAHPHRQEGERQLRDLGLPSDAWYVGLHAREGGFYGDGLGTMSEHRSAHIEDYFAAIEEITYRGGWVIRLGDSSMRPLPKMANVIDYAHSGKKSELMDIFLLATSRFVIGTTSGLSTVAMSFGTPMLLLNCISNDWQIWTDGTDFVPKLVYSRAEQRYLGLSEMYRMPLQGYLINNALLKRHGYVVHSNSAADIKAAVKYKLDTVLGNAPRASEDHPMMRNYREALAHNPYVFGAAKPVLPFLEAHSELLYQDGRAMGALPDQPSEYDRAVPHAAQPA